VATALGDPRLAELLSTRPALHRGGCFPRRLLEPGETILFEIRPSFAACCLTGTFRRVFGGLCLMISGVFIAFELFFFSGRPTFPVLGTGSLLLGLGILAIPGALDWSAIRYAVTDRQLIKKGWGDPERLPYADLLNLGLHWTPLGRLFGYAILTAISETGYRSHHWERVPKPLEVMRFVSSVGGLLGRAYDAEEVLRRAEEIGVVPPPTALGKAPPRAAASASGSAPPGPAGRRETIDDILRSLPPGHDPSLIPAGKLLEGERLLFAVRPNLMKLKFEWAVASALSTPLIGGLFGLMVGFLARSLIVGVATMLLSGPLFVLLLVWFYKLQVTQRYAISDRRVISIYGKEDGYFHAVDLEQVKGVIVRRGWQDSRFRTGNVIFEGDQSWPVAAWATVSAPDEIWGFAKRIVALSKSKILERERAALATEIGRVAAPLAPGPRPPAALPPPSSQLRLPPPPPPATAPERPKGFGAPSEDEFTASVLEPGERLLLRCSSVDRRATAPAIKWTALSIGVFFGVAGSLVAYGHFVPPTRPGYGLLQSLIITLALLLAMVVWIAVWRDAMRKTRAVFLITDRRALARRGRLEVEIEEVRHEKIAKVEMTRDKHDPRFGCGSVHFVAGGEKNPHWGSFMDGQVTATVLGADSKRVTWDLVPQPDLVSAYARSVALSFGGVIRDVELRLALGRPRLPMPRKSGD
jgi:hypothetical protein